MRGPVLSRLLPSSIELWYVALVAGILVLLGNGKLLIEKLGLIDSAQLIGGQVTTTVTAGLTTLSTLQFTASVANMIVWGATGLLIYSALQALVRGLRTIQYERDFDSNRYIHPQSYTHKAYWRQLVLDAILGFVLLVLLVVGAILYIVVAVPASFAYIQVFIVRPTLAIAYYPIVGVVIAFAATTLLYLLIKLVIRHHRISIVTDAEG